MSDAPLVFSLFRDDGLAAQVAYRLQTDLGEIQCHTFPDDEVVVKFITDVKHRDLVFITDLSRPNAKILPLLFAAETARNLGAKKITLVAPYLPYMRQDAVFAPGQGITSVYFAKMLSTYFDRLITVDPHLHRWHALSEIYTIPTAILHEMEAIAAWIKQQVDKPLIIGPDAESKQWVQGVASHCGAPFLVLEKTRKGDRSIEVTLPEISTYRECTPILVDDIISTGMTMQGTLLHLKSLQMKPAILIGVHAIFAGSAYHDLQAAGAFKIITCNTIPHPSNEIDIHSGLVKLIS